jgi:hypothetical protein
MLASAFARLKWIVEQHKEDLPKDEYTYFQRCFQEARRIPQHYCNHKVHKEEVENRPIISNVNSRMGDASKWIDIQLQRVVHLCPSYLKDSTSYLRKVKKLGQQPPTVVVVTADADSMYTNIDTKHGLQVLQQWFRLHAHELPLGFPVEMIMQTLHLVMTNNVFQFDDTYWLQLTGTAMGTSVACMYATIYYSYHEETRILPVYAHKYVVPFMMIPPREPHWPTFSTPPLLSHERLIDDAAQVWDLAKMPARLNFNFVKHLKNALKFGIMTWTVEEPSKSINFLDLTITVEKDGSFTTKTYVKARNLHLYIPPASAHPKGVLKSLIF